MNPVYIVKLGFTTQKISIKAQKIDDLPLKIYRMTLAKFLIQKNLEKVWFFEETFLLTDTSMEVILEMHFSSFSNVNIKFAEQEKLT